MIDLLKEVVYGGCSAKVDPALLSTLLSDLRFPTSPDVLVGLSGHDDAGVYKLNEETALIFTTDFFPPMVADPFTFGRIAATNALSDVYAMGGRPIMALNLMHYPSNRLPLEGLKAILEGGQSAIDESGAFTVGGHTIEDDRPQYGLAVLGLVNPERLVTNSGAKPGQLLILTKALGCGVLIAGERVGLSSADDYTSAIEGMKRLNKIGSSLCEFGVTGATDVTGFGLLGHGHELALASNVVLQIEPNLIPTLPGTISLLEAGCIPGAAFRNIHYVAEFFRPSQTSSLEMRYLIADAQTSGGLLIAVDPDRAERLLQRIYSFGDLDARIIGSCIEPSEILPAGSLVF